MYTEYNIIYICEKFMFEGFSRKVREALKAKDIPYYEIDYRTYAVKATEIKKAIKIFEKLGHAVEVL